MSYEQININYTQFLHFLIFFFSKKWEELYFFIIIFNAKSLLLIQDGAFHLCWLISVFAVANLKFNLLLK